MKALRITSYALVLALIFTLGAVASAAEIFRDDFDGNALSSKWLGDLEIGDMTKFFVADGKFAFTSVGEEGYQVCGIRTKQAFDLTKGPLTITMNVIYNSAFGGGNNAAELNLWFVSSDIEGSNTCHPWDDSAPWIRLTLFRESLMKLCYNQSWIEPGFNGFEVGVPVKVEMIVDETDVTIKADGVELYSGGHGRDITTGFIFLSSYNLINGQIDYVDSISVEQ